jgi:bifunctional NMN adenylyltransferase/nudix hydrolase
MNHNTLGVFIGRMRPVHKAHISTIQTALKENDEVLVLIGSCFAPRTIKNPFTFDETEHMIRLHFNDMDNYRLIVKPVMDHVYDLSKWITSIQNVVYSIVEKDEQVTIYGANKDHTSFYLKLFPTWTFKEMPLEENLHATDIRHALFTNNLNNVHNIITQDVYGCLDRFRLTDTYTKLVEEYNFIEGYKQSWSTSPHNLTFVTVDAVVECNGHILTLNRDHLPQKGTWSLPGSFLPQNMTFEDAMLDIVKDKTGIKVSRNLLKGSVFNSRLYDNPYRSLRGRVITYAYYIKLNLDELPELSKVKQVQWIPLALLAKMSETAFEDHLDIVCNMTGIHKEHN